LQEGANGRDGRARLLFHQPVAGICDYDLADVVCGKPRDEGHGGPERMVATDRQDGHLQAPARERGTIVDRRRDDRVIAHQFRCERRPHVAGIAIAVQQHDRRARAADPDMNRGAVRADFFGTKSRGVGEALSPRRRRSED
jgi:hypothetical protein